VTALQTGQRKPRRQHRRITAVVLPAVVCLGLLAAAGWGYHGRSATDEGLGVAVGAGLIFLVAAVVNLLDLRAAAERTGGRRLFHRRARRSG
jgi:hypothetical protein